MPPERNKTRTGVANTAPGRGAPHATAQRLQGCCTALPWAPEALTQRRRAVLGHTPAPAPPAGGVVVGAETGERTWGTTTAQGGRPYLGSLGKRDNGGARSVAWGRMIRALPPW